jgi:hypothetical protein
MEAFATRPAAASLGTFGVPDGIRAFSGFADDVKALFDVVASGVVSLALNS